ncbi:MAG: hypothetical protein Q7U12_01330 [Undibacterium sp.]|nr:hypothetical protein [Undibacterium sp.]
MLTPTIRSISDLINKLDRELWRAFHHRHPVHKADHFYNFCVTALAVKDHFFEVKSITDAEEKKPFYELWGKVPELVAATEIANSTKHFVLRETRNPQTIKIPKTKSVLSSTSGIIHVFTNAEGEYQLEDEPDAPDFSVELSDERTLGLYEFMDIISKYWRAFLIDHGIPLTKQSIADLHGMET